MLLIYQNLENEIIISLGSNKGDRLENLYKALALIESYPITLKDLSDVYYSPSWGFESEPFYNACASLETNLNPNLLLEALLQVEKCLGRNRSSKKGYQARKIDIDILFYKNEIHYTADLKIPHPKIHQRNFVLLPLLDIVPELTHPILFKKIKDIFKNTNDKIKPANKSYDLTLPPIFKKFSYIAIEGNIGVGKTSLAKLIAKNYKAEMYFENFNDNPYLEDFYKNPKIYSLATENFFLEDRFKIDKNFWNLKHQNVVSDFTLYKSLVFAAVNLNIKEYKKFKMKFDREIITKKTPNVVLFLKSTNDHLKKQIIKRGRPIEENISKNYLKRLEFEYEKIFKKKYSFQIVEFYSDKLDFENDSIVFQKILRAIYRASFL